MFEIKYSKRNIYTQRPMSWWKTNLNHVYIALSIEKGEKIWRS